MFLEKVSIVVGIDVKKKLEKEFMNKNSDVGSLKIYCRVDFEVKHEVNHIARLRRHKRLAVCCHNQIHQI
jgi:hypothetical protein